MFELHRLVRNLETHKIEWQNYYQNDDIDMIYRSIEISNLEKELIKDFIGYEVLSYRILIDDRVFAFVDSSEYQLDYMRSHYNTNEKCKPRYTSDEYNLGYQKTKKKRK